MRRMLKNWRRNFIYNDNGENFDRMSIQSTSIEDVKDINQEQDDRNSYGKESLSKGNILLLILFVIQLLILMIRSIKLQTS